MVDSHLKALLLFLAFIESYRVGQKLEGINVSNIRSSFPSRPCMNFDGKRRKYYKPVGYSVVTGCSILPVGWQIIAPTRIEY